MTLCFLVSLQACEKEEILTPSGNDKTLSEKNLPQGNNPYDDRIMEYWNDYQLLTFYKYESKEFWWTPTRDMRPHFSIDITKQGYESEQADEKYVDELIQLLDEQFFAYYTKEFLKLKMPKKMLLASQLNYVKTSPLPIDQIPRQHLNVLAYYDRIVVNMANDTILTMNETAVKNFKNDFHTALLSWQYDFKITTSSTEFHTLTDYSVKHSYRSIATTRNMYGAGMINYRTPGTSTASESDWKDYLTAITSHTYEELTGPLDKAMYKPNTTTYDEELWKASDIARGMLNPSATEGWDSKGVIRKKYDIVTSYFKEKYGIDLQAIGNGIKQKSNQ